MARVVEGVALEKRCPPKADRGFKSHSLRTDKKSLLFSILESILYGSLKLRLAIFCFSKEAFQSKVFVIISCLLFFLISNSFLACIGYKKTFLMRSKVKSLFCFFFLFYSSKYSSVCPNFALLA